MCRALDAGSFCQLRISLRLGKRSERVSRPTCAIACVVQRHPDLGSELLYRPPAIAVRESSCRVISQLPVCTFERSVRCSARVEKLLT